MASDAILLLCLMTIPPVLTLQDASKQTLTAYFTEKLDKLEGFCHELSQERQLWMKEKTEWAMEKQRWLTEKKELQNSLHQIQEELHAIRDKVEHAENLKQEWERMFYHMQDITVPLQGEMTQLDLGPTGAVLGSHQVPVHGLKSRSDDLGGLEIMVSGVTRKLEEMSAEVQVLKTSSQQHDLALSLARSSYYVRWGHSSCPNSTETVYSGIMGGSLFSSPGAAVNYLCLPLSPSLNDNVVPQIHADLYGAEYETLNTSPTHENRDPPCAVCRVSQATTIMTPATDVCQPGWTQQYSGFLMAGNPAHVASSEYICVDSNMEDRVGSDKDENGKLLFYTVTHCGNLPCPPYENLKIVTCAVCSK